MTAMKLRIAIVLSLAMLIPMSSFAKKKKELPMKVATEGSKDTANYRKVLNETKTKKGLFKVHQDKTGKVYFEIPDSMFSRTYLLTNRIAGTSNTQDFVAGQMATTPMLITFSHDYSSVYMHSKQNKAVVSPNDPIKPSFDKNFVDPVIKGFKIVARTAGSVVIDVTSFFSGNEKCISPIKPENPLSKLFGGESSLKGSFLSDGSAITEVKSFPNNIEIKSMLSFTLSSMNQPYTVYMHRSLVALPEDPMPMRLQDNRVGFFSHDKELFSSSKDQVEQYTIINRWRLEPRDEDRKAYFAGQLVEPKKKIIFYVDSAFPEKWRGAVKEGIEYWNQAFEAAGFKNAIEARDYPKNDPNFDPDDMRYSCIKYCVTTTANAMGPSFVDPRTGEILVADVIWYHNILKLVHDWRFTQTGAVDPRVRKPVFDDDVMYESLTYVAAHEVGHTLGLMHNMGASYSFPLEKLRDPEFTQKYGTTPSIMDYARNNFVAQPGDLERGVKLTPPHIGVYDIYAINWGYRIIPGAKTMNDERATLNQWIREKDGDPMYEFGAQQIMGIIDPTDQTEDLGNNHIEAGNLSISNLKIIMNHLEEWVKKDGENYDNVNEMHKAVIKQYIRHTGHVMPYIGGVVYKEIRQGANDGNAKTYISKAKTKEAMLWLLDQVRTNDWITPASLIAKTDEEPMWKEKLERNVIACFLNSTNLQTIKAGYEADPKNNYSLRGFMDDAFAAVFEATYKNKALNGTETNMQNAYIDNLIKKTGLIAKPSSKKSFTSIDIDAEYQEFMSHIDEPSIPCNHPGCSAHEDGDSFYRIVFGFPTLSSVDSQPMMTGYLKKILALYRQKKAATTDKTTREFYEYQIMKIENLFE